MKINEKHLTVIYTINDPEAFKPELDRLMKMFTPSDGKAFCITAISRDHEMHRLELIEQAIEANQPEVIEEILGINNIHTIENISDIE